jgi:hypothetical protein
LLAPGRDCDWKWQLASLSIEVRTMVVGLSISKYETDTSSCLLFRRRMGALRAHWPSPFEARRQCE